MARVYTYAMIATGMMLLFNIAGIPTGVDSILTFLGISTTGTTISTSAFFVAVALIFTGVATGGIIIGFFTRTTPESYLIAPLCTLLLIFVGTFVSVVNYVNTNSPGWAAYLITIIFLPITVGYVLSLVEFWRGTA